MFEKLDARTLYVTQTPQLAVFPDKPEPPRREDTQLNYAAVLKRYALTDEEYSQWRADGFPAPDKSGRGPASLMWRAEKVFEWESRVRAIAARLPKR